MTKTALLVVDVQRVYTDRDSELMCAESDATIANINSLIAAFESRRLPIVFIRHVHKADGSDTGRMFDFAGEVDDFNFKDGSEEVLYAPGLHRPTGSVELTKTRYSAFRGTRLDEVLRNLNVGAVVVCGFMTNFCCESTAREAHDRDYYVTFVTDATGCPDLPELTQAEIRSIVGALLGAGFATVARTAAVVRDLQV